MSSRGLTWVTRRHSWLQRVTGFTEGYRGCTKVKRRLQRITEDCKKVQGVTKVTGCYKALPWGTNGYKELQRVLKGYRGVTESYWGLQLIGMVWYGNFIYTRYFLQVYLYSSIEN